MQIIILIAIILAVGKLFFKLIDNGSSSLSRIICHKVNEDEYDDEFWNHFK